MGAAPSPDLDARADGGAQPYDFRRAQPSFRDKETLLAGMYERVVKSVDGWLLNKVRSGVSLQLDRVEQMPFVELVRTLPKPCVAFTFEVQGTGGQHGIVDIGSEFAGFLVERLFGGAEGSAPKALGRALTPIERLAIRAFADRVVGSLCESWRDYVPLTAAVNGFESRPEVLRHANPDDPMLVASVQVTLDSVSSFMTVCIPIAVVQAFFVSSDERRTSLLGTEEEQALARRHAELGVRGSRVRVAARFPSFQVSLHDLLLLKPGSVLTTQLPRSSTLNLVVGTQPRFRVAPGRMGSNLAVRVIEGPHAAPEDDAVTTTRT
ncbi:MAG: FliM/FliN family flagellar motor switch protein [Gemmatimonadota bacterium]